MSALTDIADRVRDGLEGRIPGLRPNYPPLAVEVDQDGIVLVRVRRKGRGKPQLEVHQSRPMPESSRGASIFRPALGSVDEITAKVRELLQATGTRPGRASLILPDNLAKISLVRLPDRPGSRKQLDEIVRFKLRRAVPFRLEDAVLSYQVLPGEGRGVDVLVILLRRLVLDQYERVLSGAGLRVGLVDLCTPNLLNLARNRLTELAGDGDAALFNFAHGYFSLIIVRAGRIIFYRCKSVSHPEGEDVAAGPGAALTRELSNSLAYHQEKLDGDGLRAAVFRSVAMPVDAVGERLVGLGIDRVEPIDPGQGLALPEGVRLQPEVAQRLAPAVGAAVGRA